MNELIQRIEEMRAHLGMTKRELALKAEISEEYYWRIITGKAPGCSYVIIDMLREAVGIKIVQMIDFDVIVRIKQVKTRKK